MRILVTGARGFIGAWVCKRLDQMGADWLGFEGDVCNLGDFSPYQGCDTVIHLAAKVRNTENAENLIQVNTFGTMNVLRFAAARGGRVIFASSYLYGDSSRQPITEEHPITYADPYSFSKFLAEQAMIGWHQFFGVSGIIFRIFNVYGPGQSSGFLLPHAISGFRAGTIVLKDISSRRDFIYVEDLADLIVKAALKPISGVKVVNAGSGQSHSVSEVMEILFATLGRRVRVENRGLPVQIQDTVANVDLAWELFGWRPSTPLQECIRLVALSEGLVSGTRDASMVRPWAL